MKFFNLNFSLFPGKLKFFSIDYGFEKKFKTYSELLGLKHLGNDGEHTCRKWHIRCMGADGKAEPYSSIRHVIGTNSKSYMIRETFFSNFENWD